MTRDTPAGDGSPPGQGARAILEALRRILRPLVRLLLAHGVPFQQAAGLLKQVYLDAALGDLERADERVSLSRLSLYTGIHRKDLKRLQAAPSEGQAVPRNVSLGSQLIARWTREAPFVDEEGRALPLSRNMDVLGTASFDELVMSVSTDIHPRAVLDEWRRLGIVRVDDDKRIHLVTSAFVPRHGFEEKLFYFERNLHDHIDVAARNLGADVEPLLERSVNHGGLSSEAIAELAAMTSEEGMKLLEAIDRRARELRDAEAESSQAESEPESRPAGRMNFGLYFYRDPDGEGS